jgi:putative transposase
VGRLNADRGVQYCSVEYAKALKSHGMVGSMGRTGICWDNALAESFFASLKKELVYRTAFPTPRHARKAIAEYIEVFYNRQRIHSAIGYRTHPSRNRPPDHTNPDSGSNNARLSATIHQ